MRQYPILPFSFTVSITGGIQLPSAGIPVYIDLGIERNNERILPSDLVNKCIGFTIYRINGNPTYTIYVTNFDDSTSSFSYIDISERDSFIWYMKDVRISNISQPGTGLLVVFYKQFG